MLKFLKSFGPAIIVAAVVLGPGSVVTGSKVGAGMGLIGLPFVILSTILMIGMVALSARLGVVYKGSVCDELAARLGRPFTIFCGIVLFLIATFYQTSNNFALLGSLEPLMDEPLGFGAKAGFLIAINGVIVGILFLVRGLYRSVEKFMKILVGIMLLAFLINFVVVFSTPQSFEPQPSSTSPDIISLLALIGTTFIVAGAFYQSYLVKEKGWGISDARKGLLDSIVSISFLGIATSIIVLTSWRVFYGNPDAPAVGSMTISQIAGQLEPAFGTSAKIIFAFGILAAGLSSFLINSMIGGTVLSDSLGTGSRLDRKGPLFGTTAVLLLSMSLVLLSGIEKENTAYLITMAQALAVIGSPVLAFALVFLGTRKELTGERKVPGPILVIAMAGLIATLFLSYLTAQKVYAKLAPAPEETVATQPISS